MLVKKYFIGAFLLFFWTFSLNSAFAGEVQEKKFSWGKKEYKVRLEYDSGTNTTWESLYEISKKGEEKVLQFPRPMQGFIEIKAVRNFCEADRDVIVLVFRDGSGGNMRYEVYRINPRTSKLAKITSPVREIPAGNIVVADGCFFVFSGVRYSVAYFQEGFVVEEKPLATVVKKDVPTVIFSLRGDGEIETHPLDLPAKGIQVRRGQKLYFLRNDIYEPLEDIRCEGLVMDLPLDEPCVRTFPDAGKGFVTIEIERNIIKIPLAVVE